MTTPDRPTLAEDTGWVEEEYAAGARMTARRGPGRPLITVLTVLAGTGLRAHLAAPAWAVAGVCAVLAVCIAAGPASLSRSTASATPEADTAWAARRARYRQWLATRQPAIPAATLTGTDHLLARLPGRRWQPAHLLIARGRPGRPLHDATVTVHGRRCVIVLGDDIATGPPQAALATAAHEARHLRWPLLALRSAADLIGVQAQAIAVPRAQGHRVGGPHEVATDAKHTFHAAILPGRQLGGRAAWAAGRAAGQGRRGLRSGVRSVMRMPNMVMGGGVSWVPACWMSSSSPAGVVALSW
jgi:hypothetical protein